MKRRRLFAALLALVPAIVARAAQGQPERRDRPARVATLDDAPEAVRAGFWAQFRRHLGEHGYAIGKDLVIEARTADGDLARLDALAAEVAASKPDVIVVVTTTVALAMKRATADIPIVALGPADPVKSGLVASLSRPGGNLTGVAPNQAMIAGKWLDLLRELKPAAKAFLYLTDTGNPGEMLVYRELESRARPLGLAARVHDGVTAAQVGQAFATIGPARIDAVIVATTASLVAHRNAIVEAAARARIPAIYARREYADAGGLVSYGAAPNVGTARAADYVNRILQGARPADLPFEMVSTYTLVLNLGAARALGLAIPQSVRVRADEVIE
jgi:putative ABC transport system substrate-binding protein